jgi:hypothetical protein
LVVCAKGWGKGGGSVIATPCLRRVPTESSFTHVDSVHSLTHSLGTGRVVLSDVLGGKDVVEGHDGRTDRRVG